MRAEVDGVVSRLGAARSGGDVDNVGPLVDARWPEGGENAQYGGEWGVGRLDIAANRREGGSDVGNDRVGEGVAAPRGGACWEYQLAAGGECRETAKEGAAGEEGALFWPVSVQCCAPVKRGSGQES